MTAEQLQAVRAERWRQKSNPVLTLEDAAAWINANGLCLFLPRRQQFLTPAPSFVEACAGAPSETPAPAVIENTRSLMIRLANDSAILPLNLFGTHSDQPDFLASREAFPYIFTMRGGRNWKTPPPKASPLATETWKLLEPGASLEVTEMQAALGREITEAAVLRSLMDLWSGLRVMPVYEQDGPTRWELTQARFSDALNTANKIAQTTGLSALVSLYLESVLAATPEEIETFLSPLTSRSKIREVVNGLAATRQLALVPVETQTMYHVAGSLPEFAEPETAPETAPKQIDARPQRTGRPGFERLGPRREPRPSEQRPSFGPARRAGTGGGGNRTGNRPDRPRTGPPSRKRYAASESNRQRSGGDYAPRRKPFDSGLGDRRPFRKPEEGQRPSFPREGRPSLPREEPGLAGERKPFRKPPFGERSRERSFEKSDRTGSRSGGGKFPPKKFGTGRDKFPPKKFGQSPKNVGQKRPFFRDRPEQSAAGNPANAGSEKGTGFAPRKGGRKSGFAKRGKPKFGGPKSEAPPSKPSRPGVSRPGGAQFGGRKFAGKKFSSRPPQGKRDSARSGFKSGPKPGGTKPPFRKWKNQDKDKGKKNSE